MPDGNWSSGYLSQEWDPNEFQYQSTMDPASVGQMYYGLGAGNEAESAIFWYDMMQEYLPQNNLNFSDWMQNYAEYLPQDFDVGYSQMARGMRMSETGKQQLAKDFLNESSSARHSVGASGFAGSGRQGLVGSNVWDEYTRQAVAKNMNQEMMQEDIWHQQGQSILDQLSYLGQEGAFMPLNAGDQSDSSFFASEANQWQTGEDWGDAVTDFCSSCLDGSNNSFYCSMCSSDDYNPDDLYGV
jgi:hypothetical protein